MPILRLIWVQSDDDPTLGGDVIGYDVARSDGPNPVAVVHRIPAGLPVGDTYWTDYVPYGTYFYRVRAVDAAGNGSPWSNEASVTVHPGMGTPVATDVTLSAVPFYAVELRVIPKFHLELSATLSYRVSLASEPKYRIIFGDAPKYQVQLSDKAVIS